MWEEISSLSPKYFFVSLFIIIVFQIIDEVLIKKKKAKTKSIERDRYYNNLTREKLKMEKLEIDEQLNLVNKVIDQQSQNDALRAQFEDLDSSSGESINQELVDLEGKESELEAIEQELSEVSRTIPSDDIESIQEQISILKAENEKLRSQLEQYGNKNNLSFRETDLDPKLLKFLETHDELTLEFLEQASEALLKFKISNPGKSFKECIEDLRADRSKFFSELAQLRIAKKEAEIRYEFLKSNYEEELKTLDGTRVEYIIKNCKSLDYVNAIKADIKIKEESISNLRSVVDTKKKEIDILKEKLEAATSSSELYMKAWQDAAVKNQEFEAKEKAKQEREKRLLLNQSFNMSASSSYTDSNRERCVPPPEELIGKNLRPMS